MSNEFQIPSDESIDLTGGLYVIRAVISGTEKFWTGSAWTTSFGSAHQYSTSVITGFGINVFAGSLNGVNPADDDRKIPVALFWDSATTPALATAQARAEYGDDHSCVQCRLAATHRDTPL